MSYKTLHITAIVLALILSVTHLIQGNLDLGTMWAFVASADKRLYDLESKKRED